MKEGEEKEGGEVKGVGRTRMKGVKFGWINPRKTLKIKEKTIQIDKTNAVLKSFENCVEYWIVSNETNTDVRMYNLFIR